MEQDITPPPPLENEILLNLHSKNYRKHASEPPPPPPTENFLDPRMGITTNLLVMSSNPAGDFKIFLFPKIFKTYFWLKGHGHNFSQNVFLRF